MLTAVNVAKQQFTSSKSGCDETIKVFGSHKELCKHLALANIYGEMYILIRNSTVRLSLGKKKLYNNQINVRALIGQSAVGYCAGKPAEKSRVF